MYPQDRNHLEQPVPKERDRLKKASAWHMLKNQHRTLAAARTPVRRTLGEAPDDEFAPFPED
jgi:hypothetical protein